MIYLDEPNAWGCYDPQCEDSTWDHECPVTPPMRPTTPAQQCIQSWPHDEHEWYESGIFRRHCRGRQA